jgi:hypothetical protein
MATGWCGTQSHPATTHEQRPSCILFMPDNQLNDSKETVR